MKLKSSVLLGALSLSLSASLLSSLSASAGPVQGWLSSRGPHLNGSSDETGLPDKVDGSKPLWVADFHGASTPVIANGKLYIMGFEGDGPDLQEGVACFDAETGKLLWKQLYNDFLSDIIYKRYATSSPAIDAETGNIYTQGTQGLLSAYTPDGKLIWQLSLMELYGRLTFPNGRTATPVIDQDLVIVHGITANWGGNGPGGDRFYAFDKKTGELVWTSSPAGQPKDSSYSYYQFGWLDGKRVIYSSAGDGSVVCMNARTGDPIWRVVLGKAGINASVLLHNNDKVIGIYGTPYELGQMVALKVPHVTPKPGEPVVVERAATELWAKDISTSASSPILVGDTIYITAEKGDLYSVDAITGKINWSVKLGIEQRNSSPIYADGKLYVPILDDPDSKVEGEGEAGTKGGFYVIKPGKDKGEILSHTALEGRCFGTPAVYNGKVYMQTAKQLYAFGKKGNNPGLAAAPAPEKWPAPGPAAQLQVIPSEVLLRPGQAISFRIRKLDANGLTVEEVKDVSTVKWESFIPPTAKVKAKMNGAFNDKGQLVAGAETIASAGAFQATLAGLHGYIRGRVLPYLPIKQDFESFQLSETQTNENAQFAYPPLPWIGARFKFDIREKDGTKAMVKTIDNRFFQRATVLMGDPSTKNYTIEADVMSEGNKRKMSDVGVINQRYRIVLKGNEKKLEISSNDETFRFGTEFAWAPNTWYHLKSRVDVAADGSGVVRAKAWKRDEPEPAAWTFEVPHKHAHQNGCPGLFGFSPQDMRVYIDNISVTAN